MSRVSFLEKLLEGVEVEWDTLGGVAKIQRGASPRPIAKFITDDVNGIAWIKIGDTSPASKYVSKTAQKITHEGAKQSRVLKKGDFIMSNSMSFGRPYILNIDGAIHDGWASISDFENKLDSDYLFHYLSSNSVQNYWISKINSGSVSNLNADIIKTLQIPIPPLNIQAEIVRILDAFTALTAELTAELTARKKQYNYYRDQLLSFEEGEVEWKTLGDDDFFEVGSGGTPSKSKPDYWDEGNIPWLKSESCNNQPVYLANNFITELGLKKSSAKLLQKDTTLIALVGATIFKTAFLEFQAATNQNIASIKSKNPQAINDKFVFYYITNLYDVLKSEMRNYGMLNLTTLRQFKIPVPPPKEQTRIVAILDKFDALTNSITEGLPREIKLRQQQYEYYRDLLLSFPKPVAKTPLESVEKHNG
jgi:type I restriction enzyme S subunit